MNKRSQRGAARVSAAWMIVVIVLFFVSLGFAYVANQDAETARLNAAKAEADKVTADASASVEYDLARDVSKVLGFYNRELLGSARRSGGTCSMRATPQCRCKTMRMLSPSA